MNFESIRCGAALIAVFCMAVSALAHPVKNDFSHNAIVGPMVGHVTESTASIWLSFREPQQVGLRYWPEGEEEGATTTIESAKVTPVERKPHRYELEGLKADTSYVFQVTIGGKDHPHLRGTFTTAPKPGEPTRFKMAVTSCMRFDQPQSSWFLLLAEKPAMHLTLGDTTYADTTDPVLQWKHHLRYRSLREHAAVLRNMATYAMWDDHDYGPNNSDGTAAGKERSLYAWRDLWAQPYTKPKGEKHKFANYFSYQWGDVEFFIVESRFHRSPDNAPDDDKKRMLGDEQFEWLVERMKQSKAKFKIVASGSTLHHSTKDGWRIYTFARHRFFDAIKQHKIEGVMYLSGDIHQSLLWKHHESDRVGYPLYEVISSGIANSRTLSFATLEFDTTRDDPTVEVKIIHGDATVRQQQVIRLSELQH